MVGSNTVLSTHDLLGARHTVWCLKVLYKCILYVPQILSAAAYGASPYLKELLTSFTGGLMEVLMILRLFQRPFHRDNNSVIRKVSQV